MMISVHHLAAYGGPYAGSFVPMLAGTAREAARRGHPTTVWLRAGSHDREWVPELAEVATLRWLPDAGAHRDVRRVAATLRSALAANDGPAILHTHFAEFDLAAVLAGAARRRTAVFWHEHGRPPSRALDRARSTVKYGVFGRAVDGILCVSAEIAHDMRARGAPRRALVTFPNAIDLDRFGEVTPAARARARDALGLPRDATVVLHFSWDWTRKGGDLMLAAADRLRASPQLVWLTVPGPPSGLPASTVTAERGSAVRCEAARGDVRELYAAADLFLSCSRSEGMPYAVLEALACGLPVVATDLPGHRAVLSGLPGAVIVAPDPGSIAAATERLLEFDHTALAGHARMARERTSRDYSLTNWARRLNDLYEVSLTGS